MDFYLIGVLIFVSVFIVGWLLVAYKNYSNMLKSLESYSNKITDLKKKETLTKEMYLKAQYLNERISLQQDYSVLYELYLGYANDTEATKKNLLKSFLKYGYLYNIWKI